MSCIIITIRNVAVTIEYEKLYFLSSLYTSCHKEGKRVSNALYTLCNIMFSVSNVTFRLAHTTSPRG